MSNRKNTIEWLVEKYNYITWLRNRDEISSLTADKWSIRYFEQAKEMHKQELLELIKLTPQLTGVATVDEEIAKQEKYYNETFGK